MPGTIVGAGDKKVHKTGHIPAIVKHTSPRDGNSVPWGCSEESMV